MIKLGDVDLTIHFHGIDLTQIDSDPLIVALRQGAHYVESRSVTVADRERMIASFTQADTARFCEGDAELQINYWLAGKRKPVKKIPIKIDDNITDRVIENG